MRLWNLRQNLSVCLLTVVVLTSCRADAGQDVAFVVGQDISAIDGYVESFGHVPDGVMSYTSLQDLEGLWTPADHGGGTQYADELLRKYPKAFLQLGLYLVDILPEISRGVYDGNLKKFSDWLKSVPVKVYLRVGYEFDGPHNRYDPQEYQAAYRYIADFLRREGVENVEYVWHSYGEYVEGDRMRWYPGDEYVDWVGISFYNPYSQANHKSVVKIARQKHKPLMVAESTPYQIGVGHPLVWKKWYRRYFDFIRDYDVRMFCYINWDWDDYRMFSGQGWGNGRIQDNPQIREKWIEQLGRGGYIDSQK